MNVYRIDLSSWTASFRYPNLISGYQPTLDVPPISTVLGLINAAAGKYIKYSKLMIGYYFEYETKSNDLETIYQIELKSSKKGSYPSGSTKSNVINREFLFNCKLCLYLIDENLIDFFKNPYYTLLLGRSGDLVSIDSIRKVELEKSLNSENLKGQLVPFSGNFLPGEIQALPKYFTNSIPRNNLGTEAYSVISCNSGKINNLSIETYTDLIVDKHIDIYFHKLNFSS